MGRALTFLFAFFSFTYFNRIKADHPGFPNWCRIPTLQHLRIMKENEFGSTIVLDEWQLAGTTISVHCIDGYTMTDDGPTALTCMANKEPGTGFWNGTWPSCEKNVCSWCVQGETFEFYYGTQKLAQHAAGYPEGTTLSPVCPGDTAATNSLICQRNGLWSGIISGCIPKESKKTTDVLSLGDFGVYLLIVTVVLFTAAYGVLTGKLMIRKKRENRTQESLLGVHV